MDYLKVGDVLPRLRKNLLNGDGTPVDLTGGTVTLRMRALHGAVKIAAGAVSIVDAPAALVEYAWQAADSDTPGIFDYEWVITYSGNTETVPNNGFGQLTIGKNLS